MTGNPETILRKLDGCLNHEVRLILYGRAALALGYPDVPADFHATLDVDAILPGVEMSSIEQDDDFWQAIEKTNELLVELNLYLTHLFVDDQVVLRHDWLDHIEPIELDGLTFLRPFRPHTLDLILTKMMRVDPQDRMDIDFLMCHSELDACGLERLLGDARIPEITEIRQAFDANAAWLRERV